MFFSQVLSVLILIKYLVYKIELPSASRPNWVKLGVLAYQSADLGKPTTQAVSSDCDCIVVPHKLAVLLNEGVIHQPLVGVPVRFVENLLREHLERHLEVGFQLLQIRQFSTAVHYDHLFLRLVDEACTTKA